METSIRFGFSKVRFKKYTCQIIILRNKKYLVNIGRLAFFVVVESYLAFTKHPYSYLQLSDRK